MKALDLNNIFHHKDYRSYMAHRLASEGKRGQVSRAAESLGVQPSFISRVLNSEIHLTNDHAFKLSGFWGLDSFESEYFLKIVEWARASQIEYRNFLESQINEIRSNNLDVGKRSGRSAMTFEGQSAIYFSSWVYGAIHFLTAIPQFQTAASIAKKLSLDPDLVDSVLRTLKEMNFIKQVANRWEYVGGEFHLPKGSPLAVQNNFNWRTRAITQSQSPNSEGIHYTHVYSISKKDLEMIRSKILDFIAEVNRLSGPSKSEEQAILNVDFFKSGL